MGISNICPACGNPLADFACGNDNCERCTKDEPYERLVVVSRGENKIACPYCGFSECFSFWEVQNIELFIAIQCAGIKPSLRRAGELADKRKNKVFGPSVDDFCNVPAGVVEKENQE